MPEQGNGEVILVPVKSKMVIATMIDPGDGSVKFHVVTTKFFNLLSIGVVTLLLAGLVILGLLLVLKNSVDDNSQKIEQLTGEQQ